jgi:hypothetical protein
VVLPAGHNLQYIEQTVATQIKQRIQPYTSDGPTPLIKDYNLFSFGGNVGGFVYSADPQRVSELMTLFEERVFANIPDATAYLSRGSMINVASGGDGRTLRIDVTGADMQALQAVASVGIETLAQVFPKASARPTPLLKMTQPELQLVPHDMRIAQAGLTRNEVARYVQAFTSGMFVGEYFDGDERMNVFLRSAQWHSPEALAQLPLVTPQADVQKLGALARIERTVGPAQLPAVNVVTVKQEALIYDYRGNGHILGARNTTLTATEAGRLEFVAMPLPGLHLITQKTKSRWRKRISKLPKFAWLSLPKKLHEQILRHLFSGSSASVLRWRAKKFIVLPNLCMWLTRSSRS